MQLDEKGGKMDGNIDESSGRAGYRRH